MLYSPFHNRKNAMNLPPTAAVFIEMGLVLNRPQLPKAAEPATPEFVEQVLAAALLALDPALTEHTRFWRDFPSSAYPYLRLLLRARTDKWDGGFPASRTPWFAGTVVSPASETAKSWAPTHAMLKTAVAQALQNSYTDTAPLNGTYEAFRIASSLTQGHINPTSVPRR